MATSRRVMFTAVLFFLAGRTACLCPAQTPSRSPWQAAPNSAMPLAAATPPESPGLSLESRAILPPGGATIFGSSHAAANDCIDPAPMPDGPVTAFAGVLLADEAATAPTEAELAQQILNPVAALISVPLQFNGDFGIGPKDAARYTLNIQPVIPFSLNENWNLITRTIVPLIDRESSFAGQDYKFGTGDIQQSFFFSPKQPTYGVIWGFGPTFFWPTATDDSLGCGQWAAGVTGLVLRQESGWTYGILANHLWSYAGPRGRQNVNATFIQPFINYTFPTHTTLGLNTESTYDWTNKQWTVPINLTVSQLLKIGGQPMSFGIGGRYYAEGPSGGPEWGLRFVVTFMFPQ